MTRGARRAASAFALVALLLTPAGLAQDQTLDLFLSRYSLEGRIIGANELPLARREVVVTIVGDEMTTPCEEGHRNKTDAWGDFRFCWAHARIAPGARAEIVVGNVTRTIVLDPTFRRSYTPLQDPAENGTAPPTWNETYLFAGRAWTARPVLREDLQLIGLPVAHLPVNVTVNDSGVLRRESTVTDAYGDFTYVLTTSAVRNTTVTLELAGQTQTGILDPSWHRSQTPYIVRAFEDFSGTGGAGTSGDGSPGSATPTVSPWLVVAGVVALVAAILAAARASKTKGK